MPSFCVVSNCDLKYSHSENISFHKFPVNNPEILDLWIKFTGRDTMWKPSRWSSICSRHFNKSDFRDIEFLSRKCLKKNAVPTIIIQNNISYETYHISNHLINNNNNAPALHLNNEIDEYGAICEAQSDCSNKNIILFETTCRLCGERINQFSNDDDSQIAQNLDDFGIDTMIRKCLPTMIFGSDNEQSRVICGYCNSKLKQYSEFVDRVQSYQKDLIYNNSNCQDFAETNNNNQPPVKDTLPESSNSIFIKQEPTVNVKQEKSDGHNNSRRPQDLLKIFHPTIRMPSNHEENFQTVVTKSLNAENLVKQTGNEREQMGSCEVMEIITLNNPVSFIDLAAEDDPTGHADCTNKLKTESLLTLDINRHVEVEHAYAKIVHRAGGTIHHLKQEMSDIMNNDLDENTEHANDSISNEINSVETEPKFPDTLTSEINIKCQSIDHNQEHLPPKLMKRECSFCDTVFESVTEYLRHKAKIHRSTTCRRCNRKFSSQLFLNNHERHCNKNFKSIDNNYLNRKRRGMCSHKENTKKKKSRLHEGVSDHSAVSKTFTVYASDLGKFVCSFCYRLFKRAKNFVEHQEMHIKYNHQKDPKQIFTNQLLLLPEQNVKENLFSSRILPRNLKTLETVVKDVQVICMNQCDLNQLTRGEAPFRSDEALTVTQAKFIFCSLCPNSNPNKFKTISGLKQHISGFHYKIKPHFCSKCGASFSLKSDSFRCRHSRSDLAKNNSNN